MGCGKAPRGGGFPWRWVPGGGGCLRQPGAVGRDGMSRHGVGWGLAAAGPLVGAPWRRNPSPNVNATNNSNPPKSPPPSLP